MYDRDLTNTWRIEVRFDEDETHTHATVHVDFGDGDALPRSETPAAIPRISASP